MFRNIMLPAVAWAASCTLTIDDDQVYALTTYTFTFKPSTSEQFSSLKFDFSEESGIKISDQMSCEAEPKDPVTSCIK